MTGRTRILLDGLPHAVDVCGMRVRIRTGHRTWMRVQMATEDPRIPKIALGKIVLRAAYSDKIKEGETRSPYETAMRHPAEAISAALSFMELEEPERPKPRKRSHSAITRSWDWTWDARYVLADFQRFYGIDLSDRDTRLHWWRFWSLFTALPADSASMEVVRARTADEDGAKGDALRAMRERKAALMLPARNRAEALAANTLRWGEDG